MEDPGALGTQRPLGRRVPFRPRVFPNSEGTGLSNQGDPLSGRPTRRTQGTGCDEVGDAGTQAKPKKEKSPGISGLCAFLDIPSCSLEATVGLEPTVRVLKVLVEPDRHPGLPVRNTNPH